MTIIGSAQHKKQKRFVDLAAVEEAVNDNRIAVWMDGNGLIHMRNNRSKKEIMFMPTYDMESWMDE